MRLLPAGAGLVQVHAELPGQECLFEMGLGGIDLRRRARRKDLQDAELECRRCRASAAASSRSATFPPWPLFTPCPAGLTRAPRGWFR